MHKVFKTDRQDKWTKLNWIELIPEKKFMLVLDSSASMSGSKMDQLKIGANFWIDYLNSGEFFGIISFFRSAKFLMKLEEVPENSADWRKSKHGIIKRKVSANTGEPIGDNSNNEKTAIAEALRIGLKKMIVKGISVGQTMILCTDGRQNIQVLLYLFF